MFPYFAPRRISEIEPIELLAALRRVEERGALDVASRVLMTARAVGRYAVAIARVPRDITADLKGALTPHKKRHFAGHHGSSRTGYADPRHSWLPGRAHRAYGSATGSYAFPTSQRLAAQ
ncbi:phage integrase central domain-containing protein [Variovorax sp. LARHSF232]